MAQRGPARWLPAALLFLWVPGCLSLSGPSRMTGTVGGSLSVQCQYEEEFMENTKYWCTRPCLPLKRNKIVETRGPGKEVRRDRVSIRDHPANLTFTVTLKNLREDDEGTYWCGIDTSLTQSILDLTFEVVVAVSPASTPSSFRTTAAAEGSTATTQIPTVPTAATTGNDGPGRLGDSQPSRRLHELLSVLALLLLLLAGASLLAWRMVRRRSKAGENPEPLQNPSKAAQQSEPCYANLELQTRSLLDEPVRPVQVEVEYSTVKAPREEPQYATVTFSSQNQDSEDNRAPFQSSPKLEPEYSVIKKT